MRAEPQTFDVLAEIAIPVTVTLEGDEETFTDQIEQAVQDEIGHTRAAIICVTSYRLRTATDDCCWIGDPCPIHNPTGASIGDVEDVLLSCFFTVECPACGWKMGGLGSVAIADETLRRHVWVCPSLPRIRTANSHSVPSDRTR